MIRDLTFDECERSAYRRRLVRLVLGCTIVSTLITVGVIREVKIHDEVAALAPARASSLASLRARHDALEGLLEQHHFWTGAFTARTELADLMVAIHDQEKADDERERGRLIEFKRVRDESEAAYMRGRVYVERGDYPLALLHFQSALELADSLGPDAFGAGGWEHREEVVNNIKTLQASEGGDS